MQEEPIMSRVSRLKRSQTSHKGLSLREVAMRLIILIVVIGLMGLASILLLRSLNQRGDPVAVQFNLSTNPSLNPIEATVLGIYLMSSQEALRTPAGNDPTGVTFEVNPGETASQIADNLLARGLISDTTLFRNYLRYYGLDVQIEAGSYSLASTMTIPEIALALTHAMPAEITVRITEGWRREQIADWIDQQPDIPFSGAEFLSATGIGAPLPSQITFAGEIPPGSTLEGFLFPDTYRLSANATADELVSKMLSNFDARVTSQMRLDAAARGLTLYQVVTLASIVEREAVVADERPIIASVYLNRLLAGMRLEADPTVQYAMGYQADTGQWWNLGLTQSDYLSVDSPYNTYLYPGLPPGPIASPGLSSIQAVIYPAQTPYFFFRAACDGSGRHLFATTFEEHVNNACP